LTIGPILASTVQHFFPDINDWINEFPDTRVQERLIYHRRFLVWTGLFLFLGKLGSRRQIDYQLSEAGTEVLGNLNRLAGTQQSMMPVNKTLDNYLAGVGTAPLAELRRQMIQRLVRMRVLDSARLQKRYIVLIDVHRLSGLSSPPLRPLPDAATRREDALHAPGAGSQTGRSG
jgi:hypothetical protein